MSEKFTELVFILDRSGSMAGLESDTIGGFNAMIEQQKREGVRALVTTVLFSTECSIIHDRLPIEKVPAMTHRDYRPGGGTALLDAVGSTVRHIAHIHKYAPAEAKPDKTLVVITTDGMENASRSFRYEEIKRLVEKEKKKYGWEFIFLGANIDAIETAGHFGIEPAFAADYHCDSEGTALNYRTLSRAVTRFCAGAPMSAEWKEDIEEDYERRGS